MKLWSSLQEQFLRVKKTQYVPYLLGFMWDFNATASRMPILCFWAPLRKTESQKKTIFFVTQMPIFQHRHTNTSSFISLLVQNNRCHHSWPSSSEKKFDWVWFYLCCCFFSFLFYFLKMSGEILATGVLLSDEKMTDFKGQAISFEGNCIWFWLCFQNVISQLKWHFSGFSTWFPYIFQLFTVST